ncbi:hypothetical protein SeLEV6574_g04160 [Synchytrium endobioticum]|uniref:Uncharacterized protein n=1 Tax=Synchytrium endobioticum TaxID=286115 RepID=A0A507D0R7_9FUNG|nr:hypothetical protein SeLEV6574_g04160 [Synchytrium endobioticum]
MPPVPNSQATRRRRASVSAATFSLLHASSSAGTPLTNTPTSKLIPNLPVPSIPANSTILASTGTPFQPPCVTMPSPSPALIPSPTVANGIVHDATSNVTLELAVRDSPEFRAALCVFDDELDEVTKWIEGLHKAFKRNVDELTHNNSTISTTAKVLPIGVPGWLGDEAEGLVGSFSDAMITKTSLQAKLIDDLNENSLEPFQQFVREDVRDMRESRRNFDKVVEKYEAACAKHAAIPKSKEVSALREDDFQFYETRKMVIRQALDLACKVITFKANLNQLMTDTMLSAVMAHYDFYETSSEVFRGLKPAIDSLKSRITSFTTTKLEITRKCLEEEATSKCNPSGRGNAHALGLELTAMQISPTPNLAVIAVSSSGGKDTQSGITQVSRTAASAAQSNASLLNHSHEKEGYLFKRSSQKTSLVVPTWSRRYFLVKNGNFWYSIANTSGKNRGYVMSTSPVNVLLCNVRVAKDSDRRFCFEVYTSRKSFVLQAETEEDYLDWIETFQSAKYHATLSDRKIEYMMMNGVGPKTAALIQEGMETSLPRSIVSTTSVDDNTTNNNGAGTNTDDDTESDDDGEKLHKAVNSNAMILKTAKTEVVPSIAEEHSLTEPSTSAGPLAANSKPTVDSASEDTFTYNDQSLERKNDELHSLLKSVPISDHALDVYTCALQKENLMIQGRIFLTQNRICFHSNIVGFVTVLVISLSSVTAITRKSNPFFATIIVNGGDVAHTFKLFMRDDVRIAANLRTVWQNATNTINPMKVAELIQALNKNEVAGKKSGLENSGSGTDGAADSSDERSGANAGGSKGNIASVAGLQTVTDEYALPSNLTAPSSEPSCDCGEAHLEKKEIDVVLNMSARRLFEVLFSNNDVLGFNAKLHARRGNTGVVIPAFNADNEREVKYNIPVNNPMVKVTRADTYENQKITRREEFFVYVVQCQSKTPDVPYADAFAPMSRYCITWVSSTSARLVIHIGVKFMKNPMVKSLIKAAAMKGLQESSVSLITMLKEMATGGSGSGGAASTSANTGGSAHGNGASSSAATSSVVSATHMSSASSPASCSSTQSTLRNPYVSVGLGVCLALSLVVHIFTWWRETAVAKPSMIITSTASTPTVDNTLLGYDWKYNLLERSELGFSDPISYERTVTTFLSNHFNIQPNATFNTLLNANQETLRIARKYYTVPFHRSLHSTLSSAHISLQEVRRFCMATLRATQDMEKSIVKAWLSNWVAELLKQCGNEDSKKGEDCGGLEALVKDMDVVW